MKKLQFNLDPAPTKAALIGVLLFLEAFVLPVQLILAGGRVPTTIECATHLASALLVLITYTLAFLGYKPEEKPKEGAKK